MKPRFRSAQPELAAGIRRVKRPENPGIRLGNWLTADQGRRSGRCLTPTLSKASEIGRYSRSSWAAGCAGKKQPDPSNHKAKADLAIALISASAIDADTNLVVALRCRPKWPKPKRVRPFTLNAATN